VKSALFTRRNATPDFVEEVRYQHYVIFAFSCLSALGRHQHDEALSVWSKIQVQSEADVRKRLTDPYAGLAGNKGST
jgi:hypothetical protein